MPRVPHATPTVASTKPIATRNLQIGAIIVVAVILIAAVAYFVTRRNAQGGEEITTASGLKIQDIKVGDGASPKPGQTVRVNYTGWLENGTEFDSSSKHGGPAQFQVGPGLIKGWNEGLATMKVGGKRILVVPSNLGYGARGNPPTIPPNSNLRFEIELLDVR